MNLTSTAEEVARRLGHDPAHVQAIIATFLAVVLETVAGGSIVRFRNFGTFKPTQRGIGFEAPRRQQKGG